MEKTALDISEKAILNGIKSDRHTFYRKVLSNWDYCHLFCTHSAGTGWQARNYGKYRTWNPRLGAELLMIGRAIQFDENFRKLDTGKQSTGWESEINELLLRLHKKLWGGIRRERKRKKYKQELKVSNTEWIKELLTRGYVDYREITYSGVYLANPKFNLNWKQVYDTKTEAKETYKRFGIPGITKIIEHQKQ